MIPEKRKLFFSFLFTLQSSTYIQLNCCAHNSLFNLLPIVFKITNIVLAFAKRSVWLL